MTDTQHIKAYVLIDCKPRTARRLVSRIRAMDGVLDADSCWGRYEIIATVKVSDLDSLETLVCDKIKALPGVTNTMTQIAKKGE